MADDPDPIAPNTRGTVTSVKRHGASRDAWVQVEVEWDMGSAMGSICNRLPRTVVDSRLRPDGGPPDLDSNL